MKKTGLAVVLAIGMWACNNGGTETTTTNNDTLDAEMRGKGEESSVRPVEDNIPDSMTLQNDSVIVPEQPAR